MSSKFDKVQHFAEKVASPAYSLPSSGGGFIIGTWTGSDLLLLLSLILISIQIVAWTVKLHGAWSYWKKFIKDQFNDDQS